jgi:tRNA(fMet)-specific endonuclease VapC
MYLLDTNACIQVLNLSSPRLVKHYVEAGPEQINLCSTVKAELLHGARKSQRATENLALLHEFWGPLRSLPFDDLCADHYGLIRSSLEREGTPIGPNDLMIAAVAKAHDLVLVTHNTREFSRVLGLQLEDWQDLNSTEQGHGQRHRP